MSSELKCQVSVSNFQLKNLLNKHNDDIKSNGTTGKNFKSLLNKAKNTSKISKKRRKSENDKSK